MSAAHTDHADDAVATAHDPVEEIAHAREHARENVFIFCGFFVVILLNVLYYEFFEDNMFWILVLGGLRCIAIAFFMNWLFRSFSFIFRTFLFTIVFLGGMIFLSMWDSELHTIGNPIKLPKPYDKVVVPKPS